MRSLPALVLSSALLLVSSAARADAPPAQGDKFVPYTFTVSGLTKAPDQVVFAYPCGGSNGAPKAELALLEEGKAVTVGKRGGECPLYTTTKTRFDGFMATYAEPTEWGAADAPMTKFVEASVKCKGGPTPAFVLRESDPAESIAEKLEVTTLDASTCVVTTRSTTPTPATPGTVSRYGNTAPPGTAAATDKAAPSGTPTTGTPGTATPTAPAPAAETEGCNASGRGRDAAPWLVALVVPLIAFGTRRKKDAKVAK